MKNKYWFDLALSANWRNAQIAGGAFGTGGMTIEECQNIAKFQDMQEEQDLIDLHKQEKIDFSYENLTS